MVATEMTITVVDTEVVAEEEEEEDVVEGAEVENRSQQNHHTHAM